MLARRLSRMIPLFAISLCLFAAPAARAQADLTKENEALKERISQLEQRLDRASQQIKSLNSEVTRLRTLIATSGNPTKPGKPDDDDDSAIANDPFSSPDAFVSAVRGQYSDSFGDFDPADRRERSLRIRKIRTWARDVKREMNKAITWEVVLDPNNPNAIGRIDASFKMTNTDTGEAMGEAFVIRLASRDIRALKRSDASTVWMLNGLLSPRVSVEPDRMTADDAGQGIFVGSMAELFFEIKVDDLQQK